MKNVIVVGNPYLKSDRRTHDPSRRRVRQRVAPASYLTLGTQIMDVNDRVPLRDDDFSLRASFRLC